MKFSFTGRHIEIGASLTKKAEDGCQAISDKYNLEFVDVSIVMRKERHKFLTDISVKSSNGLPFHVGDEADCPIVSFDVTLQKLEAQIQKRKKPCRCSGKEMKFERNEFDNSLEEELANAGPLIIAEIIDDLPLMSVSEASSRLNDTRQLYVFENIANNAVNVVYKRPDGNIGWIDYQFKR